MSMSTVPSSPPTNINLPRRIPSSKGELTKLRETSMEKLSQIFIPTNITAPADCQPDSTRQIPNPNELEGRTATDINGEAQFQVIRNWEVPNFKTEYETFVVATADPITGKEFFGDFMRFYTSLTISDRAELLGRKDWVELQKALIATSVNHLNTLPKNANGQPTTTYNYQKKVVLSTIPSTGGSVQSGISAGGRKRMLWHGHSGFALARYLGANGWTGSEAVDTFLQLQIPMGKAAIIGGVYAGKGNKRGEPAAVTPDQHKILIELLLAFRSHDDKTKADNAATRSEPKPKPPEPATLQDAMATPTCPPLTSALLSKNDKLAAAITNRVNQRKNNKQAATKKAQVTKAANKAAKA